MVKNRFQPKAASSWDIFRIPNSGIFLFWMKSNYSELRDILDLRFFSWILSPRFGIFFNFGFFFAKIQREVQISKANFTKMFIFKFSIKNEFRWYESMMIRKTFLYFLKNAIRIRGLFWFFFRKSENWLNPCLKWGVKYLAKVSRCPASIVSGSNGAECVKRT